jgi:hypothetical protein
MAAAVNGRNAYGSGPPASEEPPHLMKVKGLDWLPGLPQSTAATHATIENRADRLGGAV